MSRGSGIARHERIRAARRANGEHTGGRARIEVDELDTRDLLALCAHANSVLNQRAGRELMNTLASVDCSYGPRTVTTTKENKAA